MAKTKVLVGVQRPEHGAWMRIFHMLHIILQYLWRLRLLLLISRILHGMLLVMLLGCWLMTADASMDVM
jgi:hypothetical protein